MNGKRDEPMMNKKTRENNINKNGKKRNEYAKQNKANSRTGRDIIYYENIIEQNTKHKTQNVI